MKKLLLIAAAFLGISTVSAFAACTSPAVMHDFPGTSFNMSLGTNSGDGNCVSNIAITTWGGVNLAAATAYGTAPTGVVPGVNAFVSNFPSTFPLNATPTLANGNGVVPTQGGAVLSATNGLYANILQGNAVNSLTNPFFMSPATGATFPVSGTFWQTTQPISAASLPLAPLAATSTKQSDGTQKAQQVDGSGNVAPAGDTAARAGFQKLTDGTNTAAVKAASTAAAATDPSAVTNESPNSQLSVDMHTTAVNSAAALPGQSNHTTNIGAVDSISQYPAGATPISASQTGTTAATTATLAGTTGKTTYICSYSIRANATATTTVQNTITGLLGGTDTHEMWVPANTAGLGVDEQIFMPCHPASTTNTGISAVSGAPGTGGVVSVTVKGFQL